MKVVVAVAGRAGAALLTLLLLSMLIFVAMNYKSPEDIARSAIGRTATSQQLEAYADQQGLYDPLPTRYAHWLQDFVSGDMGVSAVNNRPVEDDVVPALGRTLGLAATGVLLGVPIALALGGRMARRLGSRGDVGFLMATVAVAATPEFVVGLGLLVVFASALGWFPIESGSAFAFGSSGEQLLAYALPAMTVAIAIVPHLYRFVRASVREGLRAPYTEAAELRGLSKRTIYWDFVMRNSAGPIINASALNIVFAVGGLAAIETVFSFPGVGQQFVVAIGQGDIVTVQAVALILAAIILVVFFLADMLTLVLNPRLRLAR